MISISPKPLIISIAPDQMILMWRHERRWFELRFDDGDLTLLADRLAQCECSAQSIRNVYVLLSPEWISHCELDRPSIALEDRAMTQLIHYHLGQREMSTEFVYDYRIQPHSMMLYYLPRSVYHSLTQALASSQYRIALIGAPLEASTPFDRDVLRSYRSAQKISQHYINFFPWREQVLRRKKRGVLLAGVGLTLLLGVGIPVHYSDLEQNWQHHYQQYHTAQTSYHDLQATHRSQSSMRKVYDDPQMPHCNRLECILDHLDHLRFSLEDGIWLTRVNKNGDHWQIDGAAVDPQLIYDFYGTLQQRESLTSFELSKINQTHHAFYFQLMMRTM